MVDRKFGRYALGYCCLIACCASGGCRSDASPRDMHASGASAPQPQPQLRPVSFEDSDASSVHANRQAVMIAAEPIMIQAPATELIEPADATAAPQNSLPEPLRDAAEPQGDAAEPQHSDDELAALIDQAIAIHPEIRRLRATASESWARVPQVKALPDPMLQGTVYGEPMMMSDGEIVGTFMISQTIPYLKRLGARAQQASFEALMNQQAVRAAEQRIAAEVREAWYRLYLIGQLLRINDANEQLIQSLVTIATAQVEVGRATSGDVVLATIELSRIEEERLQLRQQLASRTAILNRLLSRPADTPIDLPSEIVDRQVEPSLDTLRMIAAEQQPEIVLAQLRTQATAWGIRIAKLERVPDLTLSYDQMLMRNDPGIHESNPWQIGAGINLPLWHQKYAAVEREAAQRHVAANASAEDAVRANEAVILDLLEQARAAGRTAGLYQQTILPQVRQALEADQRAYGQGAVQFERVIADARNLLVAESAYHRAVTDKAIALARLEQTVGAPLAAVPVVNTPVSPESLLAPPEPLPASPEPLPAPD